LWLLACVALLGLPSAAVAQEVPGGGGWAPGPGAAGDNTYQGFIDQPPAGASVSAGAPITVSGWVVDTAAEGWAGIDGVQVQQGDRLLAQGSVGINRADVAAITGNPFWGSSGFTATVPGGSLSVGPATLTVVAHTPGKGSWTKSVPIEVAGGGAAPTIVSGTNAEGQTGLVLVVQQPEQNGEVLDNRNGHIFGIAYDTRTTAELGVGVDRVQAFLDGARGLAGSEFLGETNPTASTWTISWEPTRYTSTNHHILWIYARSAVTGEEKLVQREINIVRN
jgi:hypothetical protein